MQEVDVGRRRTVSAHRAAAARERRWQLRNWSGQPALAAHARLPDYERTAREKLLLLVELDAGSVGNLLLDEGERLSEIFWGVGGPSWKSSGPTGGHLSGELCECPTGGHLSESCAIAAQAKPLRLGGSIREYAYVELTTQYANTLIRWTDLVLTNVLGLIF
jgi:hypothetical protein